MEIGKVIYNILSNDSNVAPLVTTQVTPQEYKG